jgi:predicted DNA-binding transcriptional regulator YafY
VHADLPEEVAIVELEISGNRRAISEELGVKELDPSGIVALPVFSSDWLLRNVLAGAPDIQVLADQPLRSEIGLTARKVLALYS